MRNVPQGNKLDLTPVKHYVGLIENILLKWKHSESAVFQKMFNPLTVTAFWDY